MKTLRHTHVSAPGKAVLLGEYAVLEGGPALVAAVDRRAHVTLDDADAWVLNSPALGLWDARFDCAADGQATFAEPAVQAMAHLGTLRAALRVAAATLQAFKLVLRPCRVHIDTAAFVAADNTKLGMGSSAAVSVALLAALVAHHDAARVLWPEDAVVRCRALMRWAAMAHAQAQRGMGSGVDIAASVHGGVLRFVRHGAQMQVTPYAPLPGLDMAFTWAGHATSTADYLARVQAFKARDGRHHAAVMDKLCTVGRAGADAWQAGHVPDFLAAVAIACAGLEALGEHSGADIVSAPHREMRAAAWRLGGVYKPSGAGGGDLGLACAASGLIPGNMGAGLEAAGFSVLPLTIDPRGVHVTHDTSPRSESL